MKKFIRVLVIILSILLMFNIFGCNNDNGDNGGGTNVPSIPEGEEGYPPITINPVNDGHGTHIFNVENMDDKHLVLDGKTEYQLLLPEECSEELTLYINDFIDIFYNATNILLGKTNIKVEGCKYISIGETVLVDEANINYGYDILGSDGLKIYTFNDNILVVGATDVGTGNGLYEFLHQIIGFETFYNDSVYFAKNIKHIKLMNYDITDVPDFSYRVCSSPFLTDNPLTMRRMRMTGYKNCFIYVNGREVHNSMNYLDPDKYSSEHPKWYMANNLQLCYNAHGDEAEYQAMISTVADVIKEHLISNPNNRIITITQEDNNSWCDCPYCSGDKKKYGTSSATLIHFCNDVNKIVQDWMNNEGKQYKRELDILFFAYGPSVVAPVKLNEQTQKYEPIDDSVICDDGVSVFYAPIDMDYQRSIYDKMNLLFKENTDKWCVISKKMFTWLYQTNFKHYMLPYNNYSTLQEMYQYFNDAGADFMYNNGQQNQENGSSAWHIYKEYISSKLMWNTHLSMKQLKDQFFDYYFGVGKSNMLKFFNEQQVHLEYLKDNLEYGGIRSIYFEGVESKYWSKSLLLQWLDYSNSAIEELEKNSSDDNLVRINHIRMERLSPIYILIKCYEHTFNNNDISLLKKEFKETIINNNITKLAEYSTITDFVNSL